MTKALLIAAPRSGSGKTTLTLGLLAALKRRGVKVRAAKSGPDYIDPAFHAEAAGAPSLNLDSWAMPSALLQTVAAEAAAQADLLIVESAMGLFDGVSGERTGSAAELASALDLPVLLVLDVSGQAQSAAAVLRGFASHDPRISIAGAVLNRVGSERHRFMIERAAADLNIPILGAIPRDQSIHLPERHLGLVQALEHEDLSSHLERLAELIEENCDVAAIQHLAQTLSASPSDVIALSPPGQRIALADDAAFAFIYPHLLSGWRQAGAEIVQFSPLADEPPPSNCDACWLPGGYPELHARQLAAANRFKTGLAKFATTRPVHGECGGYMVLGEWLEDADGKCHAMTGLLSHGTSFAQRRLHLGYRTATLNATCPLGRRGETVRGHEFHYASLTEPGSDASLAEIFDAEGNFAWCDRRSPGTRHRHLLPCRRFGRALPSCRHLIPRHGRDRMSRLVSLDDLRALIDGLPKGDDAASAAIDYRQSRLTKPQGSLGRLEELVAWLGRWQGSDAPKLDRVEVLVFAGNHGVVAQGVSAYPPSVTAQMVANFESGGAAINQLCKASGAQLKVLSLKLDQPTTDFTVDPAMSEREFVEAASIGFAAVESEADLVCLGEMGIGNTTVASALAAALFGGSGERWAGRGTGVDDAGLLRKSAAIDAGLKRHHYALSDPLQVARRLGGREFAAILGAVLAARQHNVPVLLDGFAATAAAAPLACLAEDALDHTKVAHCSAEAGHRGLCEHLGMRPILDLDMRLGEATGAALAVSVLRAALACYYGMATFEEANVDERS